VDLTENLPQINPDGSPMEQELFAQISAKCRTMMTEVVDVLQRARGLGKVLLVTVIKCDPESVLTFGELC